MADSCRGDKRFWRRALKFPSAARWFPIYARCQRAFDGFRFFVIPIVSKMKDTDAMKHRAHKLLTVGTGMLMVFAWMACGGTQDGPEEPEGYVAPPANTVAAWNGGPQPTAYPTTASTPYAPPPVVAPPPPSEQECRAQASRPVLVDASGATDARGQFSKFFDAHHENFRCCFDALEAPSRPYVDVKVSLVVRVEPDGKLTSVEFAPGTGAISPATSKCITDIAGMLTYPAPIGGKPVGYNRIFDFKAHR